MKEQTLIDLLEIWAGGEIQNIHKDFSFMDGYVCGVNDAKKTVKMYIEQHKLYTK